MTDEAMTDGTKPALPPEMKDAILTTWRERCVAMDYKTGTARYGNAELEFFIGAMAAIQAMGYELPPIWLINLLAGRGMGIKVPA